MADHLFVYGTLKNGHASHGLVAHALQCEPAWMWGTLYHLPYGYPALLCTGETRVWGEVLTFETIIPILEELDEYEDFIPRDPERSLFVRIETSVYTEHDAHIKAWVYVAGPRLLQRLDDIGIPLSAGIWPP